MSVFRYSSGFAKPAFFSSFRNSTSLEKLARTRLSCASTAGATSSSLTSTLSSCAFCTRSSSLINSFATCRASSIWPAESAGTSRPCARSTFTRSSTLLQRTGSSPTTATTRSSGTEAPFGKAFESADVVGRSEAAAGLAPPAGPAPPPAGARGLAASDGTLSAAIVPAVAAVAEIVRGVPPGAAPPVSADTWSVVGAGDAAGAAPAAVAGTVVAGTVVAGAVVAGAVLAGAVLGGAVVEGAVAAGGRPAPAPPVPCACAPAATPASSPSASNPATAHADPRADATAAGPAELTTGLRARPAGRARPRR